MDSIRFLHIPKTAGSTFLHCLRAQPLYKGHPSFGFTGDVAADLEAYKKIDADQRKEIKLVWGHSPRITGLPLIDAMPTVTFLRNPIKRVQSFCQHVSEGKSPNLLEDFPPESFDLDRFLDSGLGELENMHARILLGNQGYELPNMPSEQIVEKALEVLIGLAAFGLQEDYNTSLLMFKKILGWSLWPVYQSQNKKDKNRMILFTSAQIAKIEKLNQIDLEIYRQAKETFKQRTRAMASYLRPKQLLFPLVLLRFNQRLNQHKKIWLSTRI